MEKGAPIPWTWKGRKELKKQAKDRKRTGTSKEKQEAEENEREGEHGQERGKRERKGCKETNQMLDAQGTYYDCFMPGEIRDSYSVEQRGSEMSKKKGRKEERKRERKKERSVTYLMMVMFLPD